MSEDSSGIAPRQDVPSCIMHFGEAKDLIRIARMGIDPKISFVSPALSCILAAAAIRQPSLRNATFFGNAGIYADNSGLKAILAGDHPTNSRTAREGRTYSRLTRLWSPEDVDRSNSVIMDLFSEQLPDCEDAVSNLGNLVGELHDNVASHAYGAGYSAAQVYRRGGVRHIEFSVVDCGQGMLHNVRPVVPTITDHREAINWCIGYRHTTRGKPTGWEQRLPPDAIHNPYPLSIGTVFEENHHVGLGLWKLTEAIKEAHGGLWIQSGDAELTYLEGHLNIRPSQIDWGGVAVEMSFNVETLRTLAAEKATRRDLGPGRYGL